MPHPASQAIPIVTLAANLGIEVSGRKARCFNGAAHKSGTDETPSLVFQPDVNRFRCYVCDAKGDAIDLVRQVRQVNFQEAVKYLEGIPTGNFAAGFTSVPRPAQARTPSEQSREVYLKLLELSFVLGPKNPGGQYLLGRGIDLELANDLFVSELDDTQKVWVELDNAFGADGLKAAGLLSQSGQFLFSRHQLLFFYYLDDCPHFVQARDITGEAGCKELSLAGLHSPVPYNVDVLKTAPDQVLICEGCIDTLSAAQLGYAAVGVPGVNGFRDEWFPLFRKVGRVTILFDNDEAGRRASIELRAKFRMRRIKADAAFPAQGNDLNDLLKSLRKDYCNESE